MPKKGHKQPTCYCDDHYMKFVSKMKGQQCVVEGERPRMLMMYPHFVAEISLGGSSHLDSSDTAENGVKSLQIVMVSFTFELT